MAVSVSRLRRDSRHLVPRACAFDVRRREHRMKLKVIFVLSLMVVFVLGYYAGAYRERVAYDHFFMYSAYQHGALDTDHYVRVLTYLRGGQTNDAFNTLETLLDSSLITFVGYDTAPLSERDNFVLHAIRDARVYREAHPWPVSSTNGGTNIQDILSLAK